MVESPIGPNPNAEIQEEIGRPKRDKNQERIEVEIESEDPRQVGMTNSSKDLSAQA